MMEEITLPIKTLLIYRKCEKEKRLLVEYMDEYFMKNYEIESQIVDDCPFDIPSRSYSINSNDIGYEIEIYDENDNSFFPKKVSEIKIEKITVLEIRGKTFKLEEV
jgi:hypothetical protein